jgi:hypothetical protein
MSAVSKLQITSAVGLLTFLWKFRYGEVNGHTAEEEKEKKRACLTNWTKQECLKMETGTH